MAVTGRSQLGEFLRERRTRLTPDEVGITGTGSLRRVAGLRREEVAQIAAISVDYYTRLEQGRISASSSVLAALSTALRLDDDQRHYLAVLAGAPVERTGRLRPQPVRPALQRLLDQLTDAPAMVQDRRMDVLAWNDAAAALYPDLPAEQEPNYLRMLFLSPRMRALHVEWDEAARAAVAALRMHSAREPEDPRLAAVVDDLSADPDFRSWWASHAASTASSGTKHYRHPAAGELLLDCDMWDSPDDSGQRLMVLTAEPGSASAVALRTLTAR